MKNIEKISKINSKKYSILLILAIIPLLLSGCGQVEEIKPSVKEPVPVQVKSIKDSQSFKQEMQFPAMISADKESVIVARTSGTVKEANFKIGDKVKLGQILIKVDDVTAGSASSNNNFSSSQVKQTIIAVEQAAASYRLAQKSYNDLLLSSQKDLNQLSIVKNQASAGNTNLDTSTKEAIKSAEIALRTAKTFAEQAKQNLDNKALLSGQSETDVNTNADTIADSAINTCDSIITGINNLLDLDINDPKNISYKNNLGVLDTNTLRSAFGAYEKAKALNSQIKTLYFSNIDEKLINSLSLVKAVVDLANAGKNVANNSITSTALPQVSATPGTMSLSSLQSSLSSYQSQITGTLTQLNGAKQALANTGLGNQTATDSLNKAYQIALNQVASAEQNLINLKTANKSQLDQAKFGVLGAANQLSGAEIKIQTQIAVSKAQLDLASLAYQNAQVSLQNVYDSRLLVTPITGTVTKKSVNVGDTVSAGQVLASVSEISTIKLTFFVDKDNLPYFSNGQKISISNNGDLATNGHITNIALSADPLTKRFLIEAMPDKTDPEKFSLGTIINLKIQISKKSQNPNSLILPLSAIEIGQNANYIFIVKDNKAVKQPIEIVKVEGETAEIKTKLPKETLIIIDGNKQVEDGSPVTMK